MKIFKCNWGNRAFSLLEVMAVGLIIVVALLIVMPWLAKPRPKMTINCASNLKQLGLAFRLWEADYGNRYPMSVYTNEFGTPQFATGADAYRYFLAMSNELNNPKVLICTEDKKRVAATNWGADFNSSHVSYFIGMDADEKHPQSILAGDSNLTNNKKPETGLVELRPEQLLQWTKERHRGAGFVLMGDGSVQLFTGASFQQAVRNTGFATNRLLFP